MQSGFQTKTIIVSLCILPHAFLNMWARKTNDGLEAPFKVVVGADGIKNYKLPLFEGKGLNGKTMAY